MSGSDTWWTATVAAVSNRVSGSFDHWLNSAEGSINRMRTAGRGDVRTQVIDVPVSPTVAVAAAQRAVLGELHSMTFGRYAVLDAPAESAGWAFGRGAPKETLSGELTVEPLVYLDRDGAPATGSRITLRSVSHDVAPMGFARRVVRGEWAGRIAAAAEGVPYSAAYLTRRGGSPRELS